MIDMAQLIGDLAPIGSLLFLFVLLGLAFQAEAASFDCNRAATSSERAICADPVLSEMDAKLFTAWKTAKAISKYPDAIQADQRIWLNWRDQCVDDITCLRRVYRLRLPQLAAPAVAGIFAWEGTWYRSDRPNMVMKIQRVEADRFSVTIDMDEEGRHTKGPARLVKGALQYANVFPGDSQECAKIIRTVHRQVEVDNVDPGCRYGSSSYFAGRYLPVVEGTERAVDPAADLLGYGIILKPEDDARLRLLLGYEMYRRLARTFEASATVDPLDAGVTKANEGIEGSGPDYETSMLLQAPDGRFWVAFRQYKDYKAVLLRYYTNVEEWQRRLPQTIREWHKKYGAPMRVQFMSAPGAPVDDDPQ
jgi:uncharacterized protein